MKIEWPLLMKKTKSMLITTYQKFDKLHIKQLHVFIRDHELEVVRVEKLLGVNIDQTLPWKSSTEKVYKTVSVVLVKFRKIKPFLPVDARIKICQSLVFTHLVYCICVWGSAQL